MAEDFVVEPLDDYSNTRAAFMQYLMDNPNARRVSPAEKESIIGCLTQLNRQNRPSSQKESSRRNYVRKTFSWDERNKTLLAVAKKDEGRDRYVVTDYEIADVVQSVHENNGHSGWDATWNDISTLYYGILRADVIFMLKRCPTCALDPRKRPKNQSNATFNYSMNDFGLQNVMSGHDFVDDLFQSESFIEGQCS